MDAGGAGRLNRSSPSCLNRPAQRTDFFHGLLADDGDGMRVSVRRGKTNQEGETKDVRFLEGRCRPFGAAENRATEDRRRALSPKMAGLRFQPAARAAGIEHMTAHSARVGFASVLTSRCGSTTDVIARRELEDEPDGGTLLGRGDPRARGRGVAPLKQALAGTMEVRAPRVSDRRVDEGERHEVHESDPAVPRRIVGARVARGLGGAGYAQNERARGGRREGGYR